ncbi:dehydrodolichyl diphosphate synthase complex subunit Dhdds-like [Ornithodoros turicata]|uniref:dehydrodolichyl diphosphate synthase complex subunit Dhdds-like n=1 Tax=Ornithodoros turicata TaxID=34597 RepID=UPI00313A46F7
MSWIRERKLTWVQKLAVGILKTGEIPKHLAVIMDGNRRFARKQNMQSLDGHIHGFDKLSEVLFWCLELQITEVTVYAFSIENFKRSKDEVDGLMELTLEKLEQLLNEMDKIHEKGVCVRALGNLSYLPVNIQRVIADVVLQTQSNSRCYLNICVSYTSRDEICHAVQEIAGGVQRGILHPEDVTEEVLSSALYSRKGSDPDLLIRTSGEVRLSDFLLWQSSHSILEFVSVLWPEFSIWHLCAAVLCYQKHKAAIKQLYKPNTEVRSCSQESIERVKRFMDYTEQKWQRQLKDMQSGNTTQLAITAYR